MSAILNTVFKKTLSFFLVFTLLGLHFYLLVQPQKAQAAVSFSYLQSANSNTDATTYTFATQSLGAVASDRYIIIAVHSKDSGTGNTISNVKVAGVQATIVAQQFNDSGTPITVAGLAIARVTAGTTGDVVVTFNTDMQRASIGMYRVTGINAAKPVDTALSTASNPSGSLDVPAGGFMIGAATVENLTTATWTGVTESYDATSDGGSSYTGGSNTFSTQQTNLTLQATFVANNTPVGVFASWAPAPYIGPSGQTAFTSPVYLSEDADVNGSFAKGSGTFAIDHPLDPKNKILYHSFVESPDVKNIYDGIAKLDDKGVAKVTLPSYFEALNESERFLLTPLGAPAPDLFIQSNGVVDNSFTIVGGPPNTRISWQVTGIRKDPYILANPVIPEVEKSEDTLVDKGEFLFKDYPKEN